ncbi:hypothetical protein AGABI2DRAFT_67213, partial [Agaricus bisporus var. bisporus H97]|uniref:hypothetical protein n=1 Tax=Agaricus bisporus var. bisporus (strain H97 / ATCC MYA-4626 / FGSC 10389) TaxID=936046 RepID=UPI00029F7241
SHTNHNQIKKAHRNGIKRPKSQRSRSLKGVRTVSLNVSQCTDEFSPQVDAKV